MELIKIEKGQVSCQGFSKVSLESIKAVSYERMEGAFGVVIHLKKKPSITWLFEKSAEAKEVHAQLKSKL